MAIAKTTNYKIALDADYTLEIEPHEYGVSLYKWFDHEIARSFDLDYENLADLIAVLTEIAKERG